MRAIGPDLSEYRKSVDEPLREDVEDVADAVETGELDPDEVDWLGVDEGVDDET